MNPLGRLTVRAVDVVNRRGKALGVRLVRWTEESTGFRVVARKRR
jgi:hypothetical protein